MEVIYPRCCGLDVHKREVVACVVSTEPVGTAHKQVRVIPVGKAPHGMWLRPGPR